MPTGAGHPRRGPRQPLPQVHGYSDGGTQTEVSENQVDDIMPFTQPKNRPDGMAISPGSARVASSSMTEAEPVGCS